MLLLSICFLFQVTAFQNELDLTNRTSASNLNVSLNSVTASKSALEDRFSKVDELLKLAQTKLAALEQPVYFSGNSYEQVKKKLLQF